MADFPIQGILFMNEYGPVIFRDVDTVVSQTLETIHRSGISPFGIVTTKDQIDVTEGEHDRKNNRPLPSRHPFTLNAF